MTYKLLTDEIKQYFFEQNAFFESIRYMNAEELSKKPGPKKWSVGECLEHLNLTFNHYLPHIEKGYVSRKSNQPVNTEKYKVKPFAKMMINGLKPSEKGKISMKMKTFKVTTPDGDIDTVGVIQDFEKNFKAFEKLFLAAQKEDYTQVRVISLIGKVLTFQLGDCFLFLLAHQQRHFQQIKNTINQLNLSIPTKEIV